MRMRCSLILLGAAVALTCVSTLLSWREKSARKEMFRSRRLFAMGLSEVEFFRIYRGADFLAEFRKNDKKGWDVFLPGQNVTDRADVQAVEEMSALVNMAMLNPAKEVNAKSAGLDNPAKALQFVAVSKDKNESIFVGNASPDGSSVYVRRDADVETIHTVPADLLSVIKWKSSAFRSLDMFDFTKGDMEKITLSPGGAESDKHQVVMEYTPEGWFITNPVRWPVEPKQLERLLRKFTSLRARAIIADKAEDPKPFGLAADSPQVSITVGGVEQTLKFGFKDPEHGGVYARAESRSPVFSVDPWLKDELVRNHVDIYRRKALMLLTGVPATIEMTTPEGTLTIRRDKEKGWVCSGAREFGLEARLVNNLVNTLGSLSVLRFEKETRDSEKEYGLDKAEFRVVCRDPGGEQMAGLTLTRPDKDGRVFATVDGRPQIFAVDSTRVAVLQTAFVFYRARIISNFDFNKVWEITIDNDGKKKVYRRASKHNYQLYEPETRLIEKDGLQFIRLVANLSQIKCQGFVGENVEHLGKFGLDRPRLRVIVTLRYSDKGKPYTEEVLDLCIGNEAQLPELKKQKKIAQPFFARLHRERTIFLFDGKLAAQLLRDYK